MPVSYEDNIYTIRLVAERAFDALRDGCLTEESIRDHCMKWARDRDWDWDMTRRLCGDAAALVELIRRVVRCP